MVFFVFCEESLKLPFLLCQQVPCAEIEQFRERLEAIKGSVERVMIAGGAKKRGLKPGRKYKQQNDSQEEASGAKGATGANGANGTAPGR